MQDHFAIGARITKGTLDLDRVAFRSALRRLADGDYVLTLEKAKRSRTSQQNRYWHGVIIPAFSEHTGYDRAETKDALALALIPKEITDWATGEVRIIPGHTSELSVQEFNDLIERAQRLGAEMGIVIPDPSEVAA